MKLTQHSPQIWTIRDFLSKNECDNLILLSEMQGYDEATISMKEGAKMIKGIRNNDRLLYTNENMANQYWQKLASFCPEKIENTQPVGINEQFRFYKYSSNQRFKRHIDGRFKRNETEESRITFMIYLNEDVEGGETKFDDITIQPETGTALCFIHELKHEGCPVTSGFKYVLRSDVMYRSIE